MVYYTIQMYKCQHPITGLNNFLALDHITFDLTEHYISDREKASFS